MSNEIKYREALEADIPALAKIRSEEWGNEDYWQTRIFGYVKYELHPQKALMLKIIYVAEFNETFVGFVAGHLTRRFDCNGELQWINVLQEYKGRGIAGRLLKLLVEWFIKQPAIKICVDADPENPAAEKFYLKHGAVRMNKHWMIWNNIHVVIRK